MSARRNIAAWAGGVLGAVVVLALVSRAATSASCVLNENVQSGSDRDRFCESGFAAASLVVPATIALAGAALAVWRARAEPLVVATVCAVAAIAVPAGQAGSLSEVAEPRPERLPVPEPAPVVDPDVPAVPSPVPAPRPPREAAASRTMQDVQYVARAVGECILDGRPPKACEDPHYTFSIESRITVKVSSSGAYRVTGTTLSLRPAFTYALFTDEEINHTRLVHTCAPKEPVLCERPRREQRIDASTGRIVDVPGG